MIPYISRYKKQIAAAAAILLLTSGVAAAAAYFTRESVISDMSRPEAAAPQHTDSQLAQSKPARRPAAQEQRMASAQTVSHCDDGNVLGYIAGGVAGGVLGNQVGRGHGNTAATIGGTLGGAYLGGKYIPLHNVACRQ